MDKLKNYYQLLIPILLGIVAFIFVTGGKIIWPTNINWLFLHGDMTDGLFAWQYFRHTPIFQNPLGANFPYGMGMGGSIVYAEPLFLFAFPFKLLSKLLPTPFQYMGLWILLCFILQAIFSWKILEKITINLWLKLLGSIFFIFAPPFIWRLHGHPQFLGQWLILAAIFLYLSPLYKYYLWLILLVISILIHPYFLFMILALWAAELLHRNLLKTLSFKKIIIQIFLTMMVLIVVMWQAGYFIVLNGLVMEGLGYYRMNLLSLVDPSDVSFDSWSYILRKQPHTPGDFEGFGFLGLGMIILGLLAFVKFLESPINDFFSKLKPITPLLSVVFLLMLLALSNRIVMGQIELFQYKLPEIVGAFRATGRMILPFYYLIFLGVLFLIIKLYRTKVAVILICICLIIQITDSYNIYSHFRNWLNQTKSNIPTFKSIIWEKAAKKYKKIIYLPPQFYPENWIPLVYYSSFNRLAINIGYFARVDFEKLNKQKNKLLDSIFSGKLDKDALYVIKDKNIRKIIVKTKMNLPYKVSESDGFFLLLPNWKDSSTGSKKINWANYALYNLNTPIYFRTPNDNYKDLVTLTKGWSTPEGNGTWTDGKESTLLIKLYKKPNSNLILTLDALPFINMKHAELELNIIVNHRCLGKINYNIKNIKNLNVRKIMIPASIVDVNNFLEIKFEFKNSTSPLELGLSPDSRILGIFISSLTLNSKK